MHDAIAHLVPGPGSARPAWFKPLLAVAVLAVAALLTAACGGGSPGAAGSPQTGQVRVAQALAFAHCMRSHGAPNFPDPDSSGGIVIKKSLMESSFNAPGPARAACVHLLPKYALTLTPAQQEQHQRQELAFAACMRRHGFPDFPDGWSGNIGQLISAGIDPNSPQLNAALTKCGF
jgi:hypothetical protein